MAGPVKYERNFDKLKDSHLQENNDANVIEQIKKH
jgi:hypothetical protein